jgi:hypothetical protein
MVGVVETPDLAQVIQRLDRIKQLADQLAKARGDFAVQQEIAERLQREIRAAQVTLKPFATNDPR